MAKSGVYVHRSTFDAALELQRAAWEKEVGVLRAALEEIREIHAPAGGDGDETYCPWCDTFGDPCKNYVLAVSALEAAAVVGAGSDKETPP